MTTDDDTPVLIGAGQLTQREVDPATGLGPVEMMAETARRAAADAGLGPKLLQAIDSVRVVNVVTCHYDNAPRLVAEQIGARPTEELYTTLGGNTPQWLVNETAAQIARGTVRLALLTGAEALSTLARAGRADVQLSWLKGGVGTPTIVGDNRPGASDHESAHGLRMPTEVFPLFETALRAHRGRTVAEHQAHLGELCSPMSAIAAENPYAWFPKARSAAEIATPSPENRLVGFPYTKYMNAIMQVNQSASVLMTSASGARALGVPEDRWVYLWASAGATDRWYVSDRRDYWSSPALRTAGARALGAAGITVDQIRYVDLYSCFPSSVQISQAALGIADDDPRGVTVTGGLPYAGGPASNYTMHAIATMAAKLRAEPGAVGLVSALGWYVAKHAIGIYSAAPPSRPWSPIDPYDDAVEGNDSVPALALEAVGQGTIETCTVAHDRDGVPVRGFVIGRLADGRRFVANTPEDPSTFQALMADDSVGRPGRVSSANGINRFDPR